MTEHSATNMHSTSSEKQGTTPSVGQRLTRIDARDRVTGQAIYAADLNLSRMVHARTLRSPHAHAVIRSIDTHRAQQLHGVVAIVTAADFPELPIGSTIPMGETGYDMWMVAQLNMARHKVFWIGQPVAVVAARDPHIAEAALALIDVAYDILPAAISLTAAADPAAPILHSHIATKGLDPAATLPSNVCSRTIIDRGNAEHAVAAAATTAKVSVTVDTAHQGYIEPQAMVADVNADGIATVWTSTQGQFTTELMISRMLGRPQSKLRVVPMEVGGGFGGKISIHGEAAAVRLSEKCGCPVKLVLTREEILQGGTGPAIGAEIEVQVAADKSGKLEAIKGIYRLDAGGLPGLSPSLMMQASAALYQTPHLHLEGYDIVTNKPRSEAYRGPGGIQGAFAIEQAMDQLCLNMQMDPVEFRSRNAAITGSTMPIGTPFPSLGLSTILDAVAAHACWTTPLGVGEHPRGRGFALGYWRGTSMTS
ncbi:MAG TPA: molybdopterin cofactor-binding domain-containing protein, partial [Hyphomicrobiaceae bacterium]|nr:molybdopterin cofactor-binding domain-containing protein [Hyphomicrobiaceae bacterium]